MPNGGEDCCGTCPHNAKNKGAGGYDHTHDPEPDFCTIRQIPIEVAFYTYCANHPFRNAERIETPIGPIFMGNSLPPRWVWKESPDGESIRQSLLELLAELSPTPADEYPMGLRRWEIVIWQLGEFRETRALADLARLAGLSSRGLRRLFGRRPNHAVAVHAREALHKIEGHPDDDSCPKAGRFLRERPAELIAAERRQKAEAVQVAQAVLDGKLSVIAGSRRLVGVGALLPAREKGLVSIFNQVAVASQSYRKQLQKGPARANWGAEARKQKDLERGHYEDEVADKVKDACRTVVRLLAVPSN